MRIACWVTEGTNTHSKYVIIFAFPLQQWLGKRAPMLRYTYIHYFLTMFKKTTLNILQFCCSNLLYFNDTVVITTCEFHVV